MFIYPSIAFNLRGMVCSLMTKECPNCGNEMQATRGHATAGIQVYPIKKVIETEEIEELRCPSCHTQVFEEPALRVLHQKIEEISGGTCL